MKFDNSSTFSPMSKKRHICRLSRPIVDTHALPSDKFDPNIRLFLINLIQIFDFIFDKFDPNIPLFFDKFDPNLRLYF